MKKQFLLLTILAVLTSCGVPSTGDTSSTEDTGTAGTTETTKTTEETVTEEKEIALTDLIGREVKLVPGKAKRIVCIGGGALRLYSYVGDLSLLSGVERVDVEGPNADKFGFVNNALAIRPYKIVHHETWDNLPSCGMGGPKAQKVDMEAILNCDPDLIVSLYSNDKAGMDNLSATLDVPVLTLSYGNNEAFDENIKKSLELLGKALNKEERATELVTYIKDIENDLATRSEEIAYEDKPSLYLGCQANYGLKSFESSTAGYNVFKAAGARNYLDDLGLKGYQKSVNLAELVKSSPDKIILDAGGLGLFKADYKIPEKKEMFNNIDAIKNQEVYIQMPYNSYYTNLEIAYADAYYAGMVSFPERYKDFNLKDKANEITKKFLGVNFYDNDKLDNDISDQMLGGYQKINMPLEDFLNEKVK